MKIRDHLACLALLLLVPCCRLGCSSSASVSVRSDVLSAGLESAYVLRGGDGTAVLGLLVHPPEAPAARAAVALSLVVDTSGSMAGHNIEHARSAARAVAESLNDGDEVSLVAFESSASTLFPLTRIDKRSRAELLAAISGLTDLGSTALFDGLRLGVESLGRARSPVRRLLLISDGRANVGPATAEQIVAGLAPLAGGVTLSTLGVGTDYDEAVLWAIAEHGAGGFHHLTDPVQLKQILAEELRRARTVVGREAVIEIHGAPGVAVLDGGARAVSRAKDGTVRIAIGDLYAGQGQSLALRVRVPPQGDAEQLVGRVRLSYQPTRGGGQAVYQSEVRYQLTSSIEEAAQGERPEIMVAADRMRIAHALTDAAALIKEGDLLEAQAVLRDERARLQKRRDRLSGAQRTDAEALIAMLHDPYIDADLSPPAAGAGPGTPPRADASPEAFAALVEQARQGRPLSEASLLGLGKDRLRVLRNVPYARHGYPFHTPDLEGFFRQQPWYAPDPAFDNSRLTALDEDTVALVRTYEGRAALLAVGQPAAASRPAGPGLDALLDRAVAGKPLASLELAGLDLGQLRLLRNASYARHGHAFRAADLQTTFGRRPWYRPDAGYTEARLTVQDRANIQSIKDQERKRLVAAGDEALRDFQLKSRATAYRALHN